MTYREHLQAIYDERGQLTPVLVVEVARPEDHPLHSAVFDRAPAEAAEAWYLHQAHELIASQRVVYKKSAKGERDVRAFHAVRTDAGYVYEPAATVAADPFLSELLLRDMEREWKQMRERYGHMKEFVSLVRRDLGEAEAA